MSEHVSRSAPYAVVGVLAVAALAASLLTLAGSMDLTNLGSALFVWVPGVTAILASSVALRLAVRAPPSEAILALAVGLAAVPLGGSLLFLSSRWSVDTAVLEAGFVAAGNTGIILGAVGLLRFFALFPRPAGAEAVTVLYADQLSRATGLEEKQKLEREVDKIVRGLGWLQGAKVWRFAGLAGLVVLGSNLLTVLAFPPEMRGRLFWLVLGWPALLAVGWGATGAVVLSQAIFKISSDEDRQRLLWIHWGLTAAVLAFLTFVALLGVGIIVGFDSTVLLAALTVTMLIPPLCFLVGLIVAVFYDGALDPSLAIRRTTVYGALGVLFVFFFAAFGNVVSEFVEARLGLPGVVGTGLYGGTVAVLLLPLRGRFSRVSERWVPGLEVDEAADS